MLKTLRHKLIDTLWETYLHATPDMQIIQKALQRKGMHTIIQDHFAVIDLPSQHSGIPVLQEIFTTLGYEERGKDYLAEKQNDFLWMAEKNCQDSPVHTVLPQVVVADFRLQEMPEAVRKIIAHYANQTRPFNRELVQQYLQNGDEQTLLNCTEYFADYFKGRDWPLPTVKEFECVREFNELLAWVLVFGRRPNHFTVSAHLLGKFNGIADFIHFIECETQLPLNEGTGKIKGDKQSGLAQGSTVGITKKIRLADGEIDIPTAFVEFVWRYPHSENQQEKWGDYFQDFIGVNANRVIESLYVDD